MTIGSLVAQEVVPGSPRARLFPQSPRKSERKLVNQETRRLTFGTRSRGACSQGNYKTGLRCVRTRSNSLAHRNGSWVVESQTTILKCSKIANASWLEVTTLSSVEFRDLDSGSTNNGAAVAHRRLSRFSLQSQEPGKFHPHFPPLDLLFFVIRAQVVVVDLRLVSATGIGSFSNSPTF